MSIKGTYRHYKGGHYVVIGVAIDANNKTTGERQVVYHNANDPDTLFVRREAEFNGEALLLPARGSLKRFRLVKL